MAHRAFFSMIYLIFWSFTLGYMINHEMGWIISMSITGAWLAYCLMIEKERRTLVKILSCKVIWNILFTGAFMFWAGIVIAVTAPITIDLKIGVVIFSITFIFSYVISSMLIHRDELFNEFKFLTNKGDFYE